MAVSVISGRSIPDLIGHARVSRSTWKAGNRFASPPRRTVVHELLPHVLLSNTERSARARVIDDFNSLSRQLKTMSVSESESVSAPTSPLHAPTDKPDWHQARRGSDIMLQQYAPPHGLLLCEHVSSCFPENKELEHAAAFNIMPMRTCIPHLPLSTRYTPLRGHRISIGGHPLCAVHAFQAARSIAKVFDSQSECTIPHRIIANIRNTGSDIAMLLPWESFAGLADNVRITAIFRHDPTTDDAVHPYSQSSFETFDEWASFVSETALYQWEEEQWRSMGMPDDVIREMHTAAKDPGMSKLQNGRRKQLSDMKAALQELVAASSPSLYAKLVGP